MSKTPKAIDVDKANSFMKQYSQALLGIQKLDHPTKSLTKKDNDSLKSSYLDTTSFHVNNVT